MIANLLNPTTDQRILLPERTWEQFKLIQKGFENAPGVRMSYYQGSIEILMPGREHEVFKSVIGMLLEIFFLERGIEFDPTGSMTQEVEGQVSAQADESYCIGAPKPTPNIAIEVVFSSGGLNKLQRYKALGVLEVWFWQDGVLRLYRLRGPAYERVKHSEIPALVALDFDRLSQCVLMAQTSRLKAAREFRQWIQTTTPSLDE